LICWWQVPPYHCWDLLWPAIIAGRFPAGLCVFAVPLQDSSICGRIIPLLPGKTRFGSVLASKIGHNEDDITQMLQEVGASHWDRHSRPEMCLQPLLEAIFRPCRDETSLILRLMSHLLLLAVMQMARIREEGIIVKALDSPWVANDRSSSWFK
jgi:hypothetical protein